MKKDIVLEAILRDSKKDNLKEGLRNKKIPAVVYGNKIENKNLWIDALAFSRVYEQAGENTIVKLNIKNSDEDNVLIYDYQIDSLSDEITHIDFLRVDMKKKIEAEVPLVFVGESSAVKELGGILIKSLNSVAIKSLPNKIPSELEVDLSKLTSFEEHCKVSDLSIDNDVELLTSGEIVVASVAPPRSEEDLAELDEKVEEDVSQVEGAQEDVTPAEGDSSTEKTEEKKEEK
ncbi:MAG TPA: 50S ribosomal protein L25 [Candidatus Moranbacteria bacterium]|nr:50S ribosomal protein L25 [Candidatus Moranbacteria bacterium]